MSEMVERVADAIWHAARYTGDQVSEHVARDAARAAIAAMREPTEAMVAFARGRAPYDRDAAEVWPDMIDEALK